jgi:predicted nucleic acid-binding protein
LEHWFAKGVEKVQCLPWQAPTALRWAKLLADLRATGQSMPIKASLIAATALVHSLIVVTRNKSDFVKAGVRIIDPFMAP